MKLVKDKKNAASILRGVFVISCGGCYDTVSHIYIDKKVNMYSPIMDNVDYYGFGDQQLRFALE